MSDESDESEPNPSLLASLVACFLGWWTTREREVAKDTRPCELVAQTEIEFPTKEIDPSNGWMEKISVHVVIPQKSSVREETTVGVLFCFLTMENSVFVREGTFRMAVPNEWNSHETCVIHKRQGNHSSLTCEIVKKKKKDMEC